MKHASALVAMAVLASTTAHAFRSTDFESHTDPDFVGYRPEKVLILVTDGSLDLVEELEGRLAEEFESYGVESVSARELFPPTRPMESYDVFAIVRQHGIDSALVVSPGDASSNVQVFGGTSQTTVNTYGNQATATTTTTPLVSATSRAEFTVTLLSLGEDVDSTRTAWVAEVLVKASGTIFAGNNKSDAKGAVKGIIRGLAEDGHIVPADD